MSSLFEDSETIEPSDFSKKFKKALHFLITNRLLLRSYCQEQYDNKSLNDNEIDLIEKVYLPRLAITLWDYIGKTSVFFEMFIDDIWMDNSLRCKEKDVFRGFDFDNYDICISYLSELIDKEKRIYTRAVNIDGTGDQYKKYFGEEPVCKQLLKGLKRSLDAYFRTPEDDG